MASLGREINARRAGFVPKNGDFPSIFEVIVQSIDRYEGSIFDRGVQ
jgi:hypothetical protein